MKRTLILVALALSIGACSDAPTAERILRQSGYTNIITDGHSFWGCSKGDNFATAFKATSPIGQPVTGAVCSGWFKGGTIRLD